MRGGRIPCCSEVLLHSDNGLQDHRKMSQTLTDERESRPSEEDGSLASPSQFGSQNRIALQLRTSLLLRTLLGCRLEKAANQDDGFSRLDGTTLSTNAGCPISSRAETMPRNTSPRDPQISEIGSAQFAQGRRQGGGLLGLTLPCSHRPIAFCSVSFTGS
jgi:hypothetical protein